MVGQESVALLVLAGLLLSLPDFGDVCKSAEARRHGAGSVALDLALASDVAKGPIRADDAQGNARIVVARQRVEVVPQRFPVVGVDQDPALLEGWRSHCAIKTIDQEHLIRPDQAIGGIVEPPVPRQGQALGHIGQVIGLLELVARTHQLGFQLPAPGEHGRNRERHQRVHQQVGLQPEGHRGPGVAVQDRRNPPNADERDRGRGDEQHDQGRGGELEVHSRQQEHRRRQHHQRMARGQGYDQHGRRDDAEDDHTTACSQARRGETEPSVSKDQQRRA